MKKINNNELISALINNRKEYWKHNRITNEVIPIGKMLRW